MTIWTNNHWLTILIFSLSFSCWVGGIVTIDGTSNWNVNVDIDLSKRDASGKINSSPITTLDCGLVEISLGCTGLQQLLIPASDPDGDVVKCFCENNICVPIVSIDSNACLITFTPQNGYYAVSIDIQDFDAGSSTPKSTVPLQFIVSMSPGSANCRKYFSFYVLSPHNLEI